jgi:3-dehydroquinate dehydratase-2
VSALPAHVLNGPNLDLLGLREPHIYGTTTLAEIEAMCRDAAKGPLAFVQTNAEGEMIGLIQAAHEAGGGIVVNPAGWSFTSYAIREALAAFPGPVIELHLSNIHARDAAHRDSLISPVADAVIAGLGARGYPLALRALYGMMG